MGWCVACTKKQVKGSPQFTFSQTQLTVDEYNVRVSSLGRAVAHKYPDDPNGLRQYLVDSFKLRSVGVCHDHFLPGALNHVGTKTFPPKPISLLRCFTKAEQTVYVKTCVLPTTVYTEVLPPATTLADLSGTIGSGWAPIKADSTSDTDTSHPVLHVSTSTASTATSTPAAEAVLVTKPCVHDTATHVEASTHARNTDDGHIPTISDSPTPTSATDAHNFAGAVPKCNCPMRDPTGVTNVSMHASASSVQCTTTAATNMYDLTYARQLAWRGACVCL